MDAKMKAGMFLLLVISIGYVSSGDGKPDARSTLKKWGMAYCLRGYDNKIMTQDTGMAREGYFQLGLHNDDKAYQAIKEYFDVMLKNDNRVMQISGNSSLLMKCLDAYENPQYKRLIIDQDAYIN